MKRLKIEVFKGASGGAVTVYTDVNGHGTRIAGPKLIPGQGRLAAVFWLDADAIEALSNDLDEVEEEAG